MLEISEEEEEVPRAPPCITFNVTSDLSGEEAFRGFLYAESLRATVCSGLQVKYMLVLHAPEQCVCVCVSVCVCVCMCVCATAFIPRRADCFCTQLKIGLICVRRQINGLRSKNQASLYSLFMCVSDCSCVCVCVCV
ncbi:hypothetical protein EYF80_050589 [Liparis tanakae]|uniref:Uncharacterized protein n=1 Tax=Liparis tanakae TaxID=230148 RepID=A0A4Z2FEF4_9TELE|nr:hypothetical protein EYF80_050589 [Liparis tanakae]